MTELDKITAEIARMILQEESAFASTEKDLQTAVSQEIQADDLRAPKSGENEKKTITDEQEEDETKEKKDEPAEEEIEPDPVPGDDEEEDSGGEDFEVEAIDEVPDRALTVDDIKDEINNLRAGRSLKDEGVSQQLADYFEKLGQAEERSLYVFLSSLAAILTGGTTGEEAPRPESMGVNIDLRQKREKKVRKPGVPGVQQSGEQAPIVVGEQADTSHYKMLVLEGYTAADKHRCLDGRVVGFGTTACIRDLNKRLADVTYTRDTCAGGSADRASLNGTLKYLRQKMRAAHKINNSK